MRSSEELKQSFFEYNREVRISNSKAGCMLVVVLMPAGVSLDYFVYPDKLGLFFILRMICSLLALILWGLLSTPLGVAIFACWEWSGSFCRRSSSRS